MSKSILEKFYTAFQAHDTQSMAACYHKDVVFNDPGFVNLDYNEATAMWAMLIERSKGQLKIKHHSVVGEYEMAKCIWEAKYDFSQTGRAVHNIIHVTMEFKEGLIIRHTDEFDFWHWSKMALGVSGYLLGWTPFLKNKVQKMARASLDKYMKEA